MNNFYYFKDNLYYKNNNLINKIINKWSSLITNNTNNTNTPPPLTNTTTTTNNNTNTPPPLTTTLHNLIEIIKQEEEEREEEEEGERFKEYSIKVILKNELKELKNISINKINEEYLNNSNNDNNNSNDLKLFDIGIGFNGKCYYIIIYSPKLQKLRNSFSLNPIDFYIPITSINNEDNEDKEDNEDNERKDLNTLIYHGDDLNYFQTIELILHNPANQTVRTFLHYEQLIHQLRQNGYLCGTYYYCKELTKNNNTNKSTQNKSIENLQITYELFEQIISQKESCKHLKDEHENYGELIVFALNFNYKYYQLGNHSERRFYQSKLLLCESQNMKNGNNNDNNDNKQFYYEITYINLPNQFISLSENIYGSSTPTTIEQLDSWKLMGITHLITIKNDFDKDRTILHNYNELNQYFFVLNENSLPTYEEFNEILFLLNSILELNDIKERKTTQQSSSSSSSSTTTIVINCRNGIEFTSLIFIGYLMKYQLKSLDSCQQILLNKTNRLLDIKQLTFLQNWSNDMNIVTKSLINPMLNQKNMPSIPISSILLCVGYPGSGKTTFCESLKNSFPDFINYMKQEELDEYIENYNINHKKLNNDEKIFLIDGNNLTKNERLKYYNFFLNNFNKNHNLQFYLLYFNSSIEECEWRIYNKINGTINSQKQNLSKVELNEIMNLLNEKFHGLKERFENPLNDSIEKVRINYHQIKTIQTFNELNNLLLEFNVPYDETPFRIQQDLLNTPISLIKYPRTEHLINLGSITSDDLVIENPVKLNEIYFNSNKYLYVEEKIDGANIGLSFNNHQNQIVIQNRSHFITSEYHIQFHNIQKWLNKYYNSILYLLQYSSRYILYGEWCVATHSIEYNQLHDYFIGYDLYDKLTNRFISRNRLERLISNTNMKLIRLIKYSKFNSINELIRIVNETKSEYSDHEMIEGVVVRTMSDDDNWLENKGKIVRNNFICGNEFWTKGGIKFNELSYDSKIEFNSDFNYDI